MTSLKWFFKQYFALKLRVFYFYHARVKSKGTGLSQRLRSEGRTRWLDLGSSTEYSEGFLCADLHPPEEVEGQARDSYFQFDATQEHSAEELSHMGTFDLIRMHHVFEHFTPEEGQIVLKNCHRLLNDGGYLLISVPDLRVFVDRYRRDCLDVAWDFAPWAEKRIGEGCPQNYYFSVFTHSVLYQPHKWCYDKEGLIFAINKSELFRDTEHISRYHSLAEIPFTHNRPAEDVCVLARKN